MRALHLTLAYDGTDFFGWQFQTEVRTVQATLEDAIERVTGHWTRVVGASRTDAGVHALGQAVSMQTPSRLAPPTMLRALNAHLPFDVVVTHVADAAPNFYATRDTVSKRYRYVIHDSRIRDPLSLRYSWHVPQVLDLDAMRAGAQELLGKHDFAAYESTGSHRDNSVRTIYAIDITRREHNGREQVAIEVEADGFLYNMVRNIAGSLVFVGRKKFPPRWLGEVLASRDRTRAGMTAPAQGLFLLWVKYADRAGSEQTAPSVP